MSFRFQMIIDGEQSLEEKLKKALDEHPTLHVDLVKCFVSAIILALKIKDEDNLSIERFSISKGKQENEEKS